jgi:hypothetical protein
MKLLLSVLCGIVLLCVLTVLDNVTNAALFNKDYASSTMTLTREMGLTKLVKGCEGVPAEYTQYCDNISIQRYGHLFIVAKGVKDVPPNPYVVNFNRTVYFSCTSRGACVGPSTYMLERKDSEVLQSVVTVAFTLFASSYACYWLINRYTNL